MDYNNYINVCTQAEMQVEQLIFLYQQIPSS